MKTTRAYYPPLAAAFPVIAIFSANLALFAPGDIWKPLLIALGAGLALWLLSTLVRWNIERGAWFSLMVVVGLWTFLPVRALSEVGSYVWVAVLLGLAWLKHPPTLLLNRLALGLVMASGGMTVYRARLIHGHHETAAVAGSASKGLPDIVYVILDGYGRADELQRTFGFDNTPFVSELRKRGFFVAGDSHSNYCQTQLSLSSALNVDYVPNLLPGIRPSEEDRTPLLNLINDCRVANVAREHGYQVVAITTGFPSISFEHADVVLATHPEVTLFESTLLERLPLPASAVITRSQFGERREALQAGFANLKGLTVPTLAPRLVLAHILAPHPPFVFDANGTEVRSRASFGYFDGSDFMEKVGTAADYEAGYVGQLQWVNGEVLRTLDVLLASKKPPIIVLQGDHGSKLHLAQNSLADTDVYECFSNLQAVYGPPEMLQQFTDDWTPVNTFRVVLNEVFGEKLPLLPNLCYYSTFARPYALTDVTDQVTKRAPTRH